VSDAAMAGGTSGVWGWGRADVGQLSLSDTGDCRTPTLIPGTPQLIVAGIGCGPQHTALAVHTSGGKLSLIEWGVKPGTPLQQPKRAQEPRSCDSVRCWSCGTVNAFWPEQKAACFNSVHSLHLPTPPYISLHLTCLGASLWRVRGPNPCAVERSRFRTSSPSA